MSFDEAFKSVIIANDAKLSLKQNHLHISQSDNEANLYLKDLAFIILESPQITLTSALLSALAKHNVVLLSCDESHLPNGVFMPFLTHFQAALTAKEQLGAKPQTKAILWQRIVKNKIRNQAFVLREAGFEKEAGELENLAKNVRLNDGSYMESRAAALYFKTLFGSNFSRDELCFENSALNYGYAVVRAAVVRAVCVSGLVSWDGVKHSNAFNQFNLADDLIEPFRAFVDSCVLGLCAEFKGDEFLQKEHKRVLVENLQKAVFVNERKLPLIRAVNHFVQSFKSALLNGTELANVSFA